MTISEAISYMRRAVHDVSDEYSETDYLTFLNEAVRETAVLLASLRYAPLIRETILTNGDTLPSDFLLSVGCHPYRLTEGKVRLDGGHTQLTLRYYGAPQELTASDTLPFTPAITEAVLLTAVIRALRHNEYDTSAEEAHLANLRTALAATLAPKGARP